MAPRRDRRRRTTQRSRGVPQSLQELQERGERIRYHGFWLTESQRDRVIATYLDETGDNVSEEIKDFLYRKALGDSERDRLDEMLSLMTELQAMIASGASVPQVEQRIRGARDELDATRNALDNFSL